ncbi:energy transducer TonB [Parahaliea mediterranea]|uniref:TonB family protein n=1 Tax=Parahaliea mediterranea TaxID=651086 RepID=A0A939DHC9_9GAMM|nr:energy transducer TonB [Parahaliea mediterranea]MBN7798201.1 TonB family protein [Parahaliea mediterranea]
MSTTIHAPIALRRGASAALSVAVTATLFLLMQALIATEVPVLESSVPLRPDVTMPERKPPEVRPDERVEKPEKPEETPKWETPTTTTDLIDGPLTRVGNFEPPTDVGDINAGSGSSTIVPVFRIAPDYPPRALRRGIEGHVDLIFDVSASGKTENIRVLDAQPEGVFENAAIRTLGKWKYKPPIQDGVPYGQRDMTTRISFRLEE